MAENVRKKHYKTYISLNGRKLARISWERLAAITNMSVEEYKEAHNKRFGTFLMDCRPFTEGIQCPFNERDLMNDTCYIGNDVHKCPYFSRYVHDGEHKNCIECTHPPIPEKPKYIQLSLFDF